MAEEQEDDGINVIQKLLSKGNIPLKLTDEMKEHLKRIAEGYQDLNEEERVQFRADMTKQIADKVTDSIQSRVWEHTLQKGGVVLLAAFVLFFLFVFFGYKLYKSLKDKERKRDEKKKMKQQKKKK